MLYGGKPRPGIANDRVMVGGTAAGLVDATLAGGLTTGLAAGLAAASTVPPGGCIASATSASTGLAFGCGGLARATLCGLAGLGVASASAAGPVWPTWAF